MQTWHLGLAQAVSGTPWVASLAASLEWVADFVKVPAESGVDDPYVLMLLWVGEPLPVAWRGLSG